jgi:hypothetical protein
MIRKTILGFALTALVCCSSNVNATEPFAFNYGYSIGQAQRFRSNLPTPPYFSIYPPVYYGDVYKRPYGASPFASWPVLQANSSYQPMPSGGMSVVVNPHYKAQENAMPINAGQRVASEVNLPPQMVTIINPYAKANKVAMGK